MWWCGGIAKLQIYWGGGTSELKSRQGGQKVFQWEIPGILTMKQEKKIIVVNLVFQNSLFKMSFTKKSIDLHLCHIYIITIHTVIQNQIDLEFHCFYLEITWNFMSPEKWEPCTNDEL